MDSLNEKYGLKVTISEPEKDIKNVDTWKIKVETRPKERRLPAQRPMMLINPYGN